MSSIYPCDKSRRALFYVEFERGDREGEFTLFRRQWMHTEEEFENLKRKHPVDARWLNDEVHPWNLFTGTYGADGGVPDRTMICWMVDALNNQANADLKNLSESLKNSYDTRRKVCCYR